MNDLTAFQRDLLYAIAGHDRPHGLAIKAALEEYYQKDVNHGRLYPNLDQLADRGLLIKKEYDKRTNIYKLTEAGESMIETRQQWEQKQVTNNKPVR